LTKVIYSEVITLLQNNPSLSLADAGRHLNVTRERIRQIADDIPLASRHKTKRHCRVCGIRINDHPRNTAYQMGYCSRCWPTEKLKRWLAHRTKFICEICGRVFFRCNNQVKGNAKRGISIRFCSKQCQGQWLGIRYGYGETKRDQKD